MKPSTVVAMVAMLIPLIVATPCSAQSDKEDWPVGSAMRTGMDLQDKITYRTKRLERENLLLLKALDEIDAYGSDRVRKGVQAQHEAWMAYREAECELHGASTLAGGTWPSTWAASCDANHLDRRYRVVSKALRCVRQLPPADRSTGFATCLSRLEILGGGR